MNNESQKEQVSGVREIELKAMIKERRIIIYVLESALMDNEPKFPKAYKLCMKDEIDNHEAFIEEYEEELKKLHTFPSSPPKEQVEVPQASFANLISDGKGNLVPAPWMAGLQGEEIKYIQTETTVGNLPSPKEPAGMLSKEQVLAKHLDPYFEDDSQKFITYPIIYAAMEEFGKIQFEAGYEHCLHKPDYSNIQSLPKEQGKWNDEQVRTILMSVVGMKRAEELISEYKNQHK